MSPHSFLVSFARSLPLTCMVLLLGSCRGQGDAQDPAPGGEPEASEAPADDALLENESNDRPERATLVRTGRAVRGDVSEGDVDWLRLDASAGGLRATLQSDGDVRLTLAIPREGAERTVTLTDDGQAEVDVRSESPVFLRVEGAGTWRVLTEAAEFACGFAGEPDGGMVAGASITSIPGRVSGCLATPGDEDVVEVPAAVFLNEGAFGVHVSAPPGVSMQVLGVEDSGLVLFDLAGGPGESLAIPSVRSPSEGGIRLRIRSLAGANDESPWMLELRRLPSLNGLIESEPNDVPENASIIDIIDIVNGWFHRPGDVDFYRIVSAEPRVLRMRVQPPEGVDALISLTDGAGQTHSQIDEARAGGEEILCSVRVGPEHPFVFSLRARAVRSSELEPYIVSFDLFDAESFEVEPNDVMAAPGEIASLGLVPPQLVGIGVDGGAARVAVSGHVFPRNDVDLFPIEVYRDPLAEATFTSVTFRLEPGGPSAYHLQVLDAGGAVVARGSSRAPGESVAIALDLPGGMYWARVSLESGEVCGAPYRLSLEQTAYPDPSLRPARPTDDAIAADRPEGATPGADAAGEDGLPSADDPRAPVVPPSPPVDDGDGEPAFRPRTIPQREPALRPRPTPNDTSTIRVRPPSEPPPERRF